METISLLDKIKNDLGEDVAAKIDKVSYETSLYVLSIASVREITENDLRIGFASYSARYPDRTYESYVKYKKNWEEDKFSCNVEPQGYFIDENVAVEYALKNIGDINEHGSFPYAIVSSMPLNHVYPVANFRKHRLFLFNEAKQAYEEIQWDHDEKTLYLQRRGDRGVF